MADSFKDILYRWATETEDLSLTHRQRKLFEQDERLRHFWEVSREAAKIEWERKQQGKPKGNIYLGEIMSTDELTVLTDEQ